MKENNNILIIVENLQKQRLLFKYMVSKFEDNLCTYYNGMPDIRIKNKTTMSAKPTRFDEFWKAWPPSKRKVAKSACEAKWVKHGLDTLADQIIANVQTMKGSDQWREGFEPAPLTYINQRRWEDETEISPVRRAK